MNDFILQDHGSISLLTPITEAAREWVAEHLPEDAPIFGLSFAIEHRCVEPILHGIADAGLTVGAP